jgi:hypothetical protein
MFGVVYGGGCRAICGEELGFGRVRSLWQIPFWVAGERTTMPEAEDIHSFASLLEKYKKQRLLVAVGPNGFIPLIF